MKTTWTVERLEIKRGSYSGQEQSSRTTGSTRDHQSRGDVQAVGGILHELL